MAKFLLHLFQEGGCDYTIGCGHSIIQFESDVHNLRDKVKELVEGYSRDYIDEITLYQISHQETIDIDELFAEDDAAEARREQEKRELEERKLLEELRRKYPDA